MACNRSACQDNLIVAWEHIGKDCNLLISEEESAFIGEAWILDEHPAADSCNCD